jgi:endonuclease V-like protein UPF0215 family
VNKIWVVERRTNTDVLFIEAVFLTRNEARNYVKYYSGFSKKPKPYRVIRFIEG